MKRCSKYIWVILAFSITFGVGLLLEYKFSIVQKVKSYLVSCVDSCGSKERNNVSLDELKLVISDSALSEIKTQRQNAMDGNRDFQFVPAKVLHGKDTVNVELRLKGDRAIHYNDPTRWSFRVKTRDDKSIFGVKRFSLHRAGARNYIYEWIFHQALNSIDLIGLKYEFIRLKVGDCDLGLYAFEEHFENSLIVNRGLPLGPIIRFNEDYSLDDFETTYVDPFQDKYWRKNDPELLQKAISNLELWRRGKVKTSKVFNAEKLAKYFALTDVLWVPHAQAWKSIRFYYNPNNGLLEPIGYDAHYNEYFFKNKMTYEVSATIPLKHFVKDVWVDLYKDWYGFLFVDPETFDIDFYTNYIYYLKLYSNTNWLNQFLSNNDKEIKERLAVIESDPKSFNDEIFSFGNEKFKFSKTQFYERAKYIRNSFEKDQFIHAYPIKKSYKKMIVEIENIGFYTVKIDRIVAGDETTNINEILIPHSSNKSPFFKQFQFSCPKEYSDIIIHYHVVGENRARQTKVFKWKRKVE